jgi:hypothetical protein
MFAKKKKSFFLYINFNQAEKGVKFVIFFLQIHQSNDMKIGAQNINYLIQCNAGKAWRKGQVLSIKRQKWKCQMIISKIF